MGDRLLTGKPPQYVTQPPRQTQPPTLSGTGNEYRPTCGNALRLGNKGRMTRSVYVHKRVCITYVVDKNCVIRRYHLPIGHTLAVNNLDQERIAAV